MEDINISLTLELRKALEERLKFYESSLALEGVLPDNLERVSRLELYAKIAITREAVNTGKINTREVLGVVRKGIKPFLTEESRRYTSRIMNHIYETITTQAIREVLGISNGKNH